MGSRNAKIKKIYSVWVYVNNLSESRRFYEQILGMKFKFQEGDWIEFNLGETSFALLQRRKGEPLRKQKTRIMLQVDDLEAMLAKFKKNNVTIVGKIRNESYGKLLTFKDPNGHWLELFEPAPQK